MKMRKLFICTLVVIALAFAACGSLGTAGHVRKNGIEYLEEWKDCEERYLSSLELASCLEDIYIAERQYRLEFPIGQKPRRNKKNAELYDECESLSERTERLAAEKVDFYRMRGQ